MDKNEKLMSNQEIKECLVDILKSFAAFCDEHGLHYTLAAGTLLGAVRHKGFIPWDDDIDVYMERDDYNKLNELLANELLDEKYKLVSLTLNNSPYPFAKILDLNTCIVNNHNTLDSYLWVDIFPLDGITSKQAKHIMRLQWYTTILIRLLGKSGRKIEWCGFKTTFIILFSKLFSSYFYGKRLDNVAKKYKIDDCPYSAAVTWGTAYKYYEKEAYRDLIRMEFEGDYYWAPREFDRMLKNEYGDYMTLPPISERDNHNLQVVRKEQ